CICCPQPPSHWIVKAGASLIEGPYGVVEVMQVVAVFADERGADRWDLGGACWASARGEAVQDASLGQVGARGWVIADGLGSDLGRVHAHAMLDRCCLALVRWCWVGHQWFTSFSSRSIWARSVSTCFMSTPRLDATKASRSSTGTGSPSLLRWYSSAPVSSRNDSMVSISS